MKLSEVTIVLNDMFKLLPAAMDSVAARVMLYAIGLQESKFIYRKQMGNGPANSFWQFEKGTRASRGGVWGIYLHPASRYWLAQLCAARGVAFTPDAIHAAMLTDDVLGAGCARLLLFTDAQKLPGLSDVSGAWNMYANRTWRPGKPHRESWAGYHAQAVAEALK